MIIFTVLCIAGIIFGLCVIAVIIIESIKEWKNSSCAFWWM